MLPEHSGYLYWPNMALLFALSMHFAFMIAEDVIVTTVHRAHEGASSSSSFRLPKPPPQRAGSAPSPPRSARWLLRPSSYKLSGPQRRPTLNDARHAPQPGPLNGFGTP